MAVVVGDVRARWNCGPQPRPKDHEDVPVKATDPKEEAAPRRPTSPATGPPKRRRGTCRSCSTSRSTSCSCTRRRGTSPSSSCTRRRRTSPTTRRRGTSVHATRRGDYRRRRSSPERRRGTRRSNPRIRPKCTRRRGHSPSCSQGRRPKISMGEALGVQSGGHKH